jgi:hypothetical protein
MSAECIREQEVLELVRAGRWPDSCPADITAHVAQCSPCSETARVASIMSANFHAAVRTARVPTSGVVWWRAQRRAREEAAHAAARAVTLVQALSVAIGLAVALGIAGAMLAANGVSWSDGLRHALTLPINTASLSQWHLPLAIAFATWLALAPVAVYLAVSRD